VSNAALKVIVKMSAQTVKDQLDSGYKLSVVRNVMEGKTEKNGNVVFLQTAKLAVSTGMSWTEKYRVTESTTQFKVSMNILPTATAFVKTDDVSCRKEELLI
jgi:hypothetical protein